MIGIEQYQKIQEYKALGLAQTKTAKALGITYTSVRHTGTVENMPTNSRYQYLS
jgi:hypothetical protein